MSSNTRDTKIYHISPASHPLWTSRKLLNSLETFMNHTIEGNAALRSCVPARLCKFFLLIVNLKIETVTEYYRPMSNGQLFRRNYVGLTRGTNRLDVSAGEARGVAVEGESGERKN